MSEMVERVALALWLAEVEEDCAVRGRPFDRATSEAEWAADVTDPTNGFYAPIYANMLARARDAIEAMREPAEEWLANVAAEGIRVKWNDLTPEEVGQVWRAMIDEVLK